jgi:type II secretory pathway pseudopilin PulG
MVFKRNNGFTLVEALISLSLVGFITMLSVKLLEPPPRQNGYGRKAGDLIEHLISAHRQIELSRGRAPLTPDLNGNYLNLDNNSATPELGFAVSLMQTETQATYCSSGNPECTTPWAGQDYLDYPGGIRLYIRPEQFTWWKNYIVLTNFNRNAVVPVTTNTYRIQSFFLLDMDSRSTPTALTNDDLVTLYINNESGNIITTSQEIINLMRSQNPPAAVGTVAVWWPCSFYDVHKRYNGCTTIGQFPVVGA